MSGPVVGSPPKRVAMLVVGTMLALAACGSDGSSGPAGSPTATQPGADSGSSSVRVRYHNNRFHYEVEAPGPMTEADDGATSADRGGERLQIFVATGFNAKALEEYARKDLVLVRRAASNFHSINDAAPVSIAGHTVVKAVYSSTGTGATGTSQDVVAARYYLPRDGSMLAVLTYTTASRQYDPAAADAVAATFTWK